MVKNRLALTHEMCYHNVHICKPEHIASEICNLQRQVDHANQTPAVGGGVQYRTLNGRVLVC
jgi:hypothetical protein